jgi:hypothetical protein
MEKTGKAALGLHLLAVCRTSAAELTSNLVCPEFRSDSRTGLLYTREHPEMNQIVLRCMTWNIPTRHRFRITLLSHPIALRKIALRLKAFGV